MTEQEARRYFNREARYYERGLPPNRSDLYAIHVPGGVLVAAPDTEVLWERFWAACQAWEMEAKAMKGGAS